MKNSNQRWRNLALAAAIASSVLFPMKSFGDAEVETTENSRGRDGERRIVFSGSSRTAPSVRDAFSSGNQAASRGDFASAALFFYEAENAPRPDEQASETAEDAGKRLRAEIELAHALLALGFFDAAEHQYDYVLRAGENHPAYTEAAEGLVLDAELSGEDVLAPAILDREYGEPFSRLPPQVLDRLNLIVGIRSMRAGNTKEADGFLGSIPLESPLFAKASYLRGIAAARDGRHEDALKFFEEILPGRNGAGAAKVEKGLLPTSFSTAAAIASRNAAEAKRSESSGKISSPELMELSALARARTLYALGKFDASAQVYETIPRFSRFWEDALLESGWARTQNGDDGGALGTLQALHAPQLSGFFQPESWILFATIHFHRCLFSEAREALESYRRIYGPQHQALKKVLSENTPSGSGIRNEDFWIALLKNGGDMLSEPIRRELLRSRRFVSVSASLVRTEAEAASIEGVQEWNVPAAAALKKELSERNSRSQSLLKHVLADFIFKRLKDVDARLDVLNARAEILELEIQRMETSHLEAHFDRRKALSNQALGRPRQTEAEIYWPFDGEFWLDEVGHYRFTLKDGCMPAKEVSTAP